MNILGAIRDQTTNVAKVILLITALQLFEACAEPAPSTTQETTQSVGEEGVQNKPTQAPKNAIRNSLVFEKISERGDKSERDLLKTANSFKDLFNIITQNDFILTKLHDFLLKRNLSGSSLDDKIIGGFLFHEYGILCSNDGTDLPIVGVATITFAEAIKLFPELGSLGINDSEKITVVSFQSGGSVAGISGFFGDIVGVNETRPNEDPILLNELTGTFFTKKVEEIKKRRPDLVDGSTLWFPTTDSDIFDGVIKSIYPGKTPDGQLSEFWGDLCNLEKNPGGFIPHILDFAVVEAGIKQSYQYSSQKDKGSLEAARYINEQYQTYLLSKHTIGIYILSQELLSTILYGDGTLRDKYETMLEEEAYRQYTSNTLSEPGYDSIMELISVEIAQNPEALHKVKKFATSKRKELEKYVKGL